MTGMRGPSLCRACSRWAGDDTCTSFPTGIPDEIIVWGGDHRQSIAGEPPFELHSQHRHEYDDWLRYSPHAQPREGSTDD